MRISRCWRRLVKRMLLWVGCIAGALEDYEYFAKLAKAGVDGHQTSPSPYFNLGDTLLGLERKVQSLRVGA